MRGEKIRLGEQRRENFFLMSVDNSFCHCHTHSFIFTLKMNDPEAMTEVVFVDETLQEILVFEYFSGTDDIKLFSVFFRHGKLERLWLPIF
jgi:hypothetical protein